MRRLVVAFFYLWYGTPAHDGGWQHWDHEVLPHWRGEVNDRLAGAVGARHAPPEDVHAPFYPLRGLYSSADGGALRQQFAEARGAGVDSLALSWWGPEWREGATDTQGVNTDGRLLVALDAAQAANASCSLHLEPYPGRTAESVREDLVHLRRTGVLRHPALTRVDGRPLAFVYDSYHIAEGDWARLLARDGARSVRHTALDVYAVGLWLARDHGKQLAAGGFDGAYTYFGSQDMGFGARARNWQGMAGAAEMLRLSFWPCVAPGYDDTRIRPWNSEHTTPRDGGATYRGRWRAALGAPRDSAAVAGVGVTSWNEWGEGTQIEPAAEGVARPAARWHQAGEYQSYAPQPPDFYLTLTRQHADELRAIGGTSGPAGRDAMEL